MRAVRAARPEAWIGVDANQGLTRRSRWPPDESVQSLADLTGAQGIFDVVNIKLDKCGGLTEALEMVHEIRRLGMKPMVGCMAATTLAIAPACVVGQLCDFVDLDAPMFLASGRAPSVTYRDGMIHCPDDWGFKQSGRMTPDAARQ